MRMRMMMTRWNNVLDKGKSTLKGKAEGAAREGNSCLSQWL